MHKFSPNKRGLERNRYLSKQKQINRITRVQNDSIYVRRKIVSQRFTIDIKEDLTLNKLNAE